MSTSAIEIVEKLTQFKIDFVNIFFDMDYTLLGVDGSLRPMAKEVMQRLLDDGHQLYVWSGNGIRWLELRRHGLESLVTDCFEKPMANYVEAVEQMGLPVAPDIVIDDNLEVAAALGGVWARTYYFPNAADDEMEHIYRIITEFAQTGHSTDARFRAPLRSIRHSFYGSTITCSPWSRRMENRLATWRPTSISSPSAVTRVWNGPNPSSSIVPL